MDHTEQQCLAQIKQLLDSIEEDNLPQCDSSSIGCSQQASLPMPPNTGNPAGFNCPEDTETCPVTLKSLPGRGIGVVATRFIPAGSLILQDDATLTIPKPRPTTQAFLLTLVTQYLSCSAEVQKQILALHAHSSPGGADYVHGLLTTEDDALQLAEHQVKFIIRLHSTFTTNMFDETAPGASSLFLQASRFNHSCVPNCDYGHMSDETRTTMTIRASQDIKAGEELCLTYVTYYDDRAQRMADLKQNWGFDCNCPACDYEDPEVDTEAHEETLAEYRLLRRDPFFRTLYSYCPKILWSSELDEALARSIRRSQIAEIMGDTYCAIVNHIVSSSACKEKWLWTSDPEDYKSHIRFLQQGQLLAERMPASKQGEAIKARMEQALSEVWN
ncbi:Mcg1p [Diaporthe helianthi]|uniref:Mcg1p n=1 Tax=Diaporthe helianthi TaxID=158607 RepID=A0A2P5HPQ6_DIAHE|nr:Mcg1p [Diaporthe helianthi]